MLSREPKVVERWASRRLKGLTEKILRALKNLLKGQVSGQGQIKGQNVVFSRLGTWARRIQLILAKNRPKYSPMYGEGTT